MAERGRPAERRDWTDTESEGQPPVEDQPPGIDAETAIEGVFPPADGPVAVEEPEVTAAGERTLETLRERVRREEPDVMVGDEDDSSGRLVDEGLFDDPAEGEWTGDAAGLSAEEDAVHVTESEP